jgi:ATP-dependent RNA helicase DeaD
MKKDDNQEEKTITFAELNLSPAVMKALVGVGYEVPTPIQAQTIPPLLEGRDLIGQAQTGTGKTAAFALPMLERIDPKKRELQGLVLAPTRELAIQVAEAFHTYAKHMGGLNVLPIYGGQPFETQLRSLKRGVQVVVSTPGRLMDHMRRRTIKLENVSTVVLDEADEMLRMGFAEDVETILKDTPSQRQTALFTATMPPRIRSIASKYLNDPVSISVGQKTLTVPTVEQFYLNVAGNQKLDALTKLLNSLETESVIIFTRTKNATTEVAAKLQARGISAEALNGDMGQTQRIQLIRKLRNRQVDVVVATDVAARGLDVEHISHVFNYDIPWDVESFVHRIGRTGRAGRKGVAILFVTPRERGMQRDIERYTKKKMLPMKFPTRADVAARTVALLKESLTQALAKPGMDIYLNLVEEMSSQAGVDMAEIAAAALRVALGDKNVEVSLEPKANEVPQPEGGMARLFISEGSKAGIRPADIVGAITNEAGIPGYEIGSVDIYERFTFVEVPVHHSAAILKAMAKTSLRGKPATIKLATAKRGDTTVAPPKPKERERYQSSGKPKNKKANRKASSKAKIKAKNKKKAQHEKKAE